VHAHQTVIVDGARIRRVVPSSTAVPNDASVIDGTGQFLIPGLWDAHVHLTKLGKLSLPIFIANGVTGVRDMGSDFRDIQKWRSAIDSGESVGPQIKSSGEILESRTNIDRMKREGTVEPVDRIRIGVANVAEARRAVIRLAREGVDHIKMRTTPDLETFRAVADQARREGLPVAAHPLEPPDELFRSGLRSVEHFLAFPPIDGPETERSQLFGRMKQSGVFMSDTSVNLDALVSLSYGDVKRRVDDAAGNIDARRKYLCGYLIADWREQLEELKDPETKKAYGSLRQQLPVLYRDDREMLASGVRFLAGTDAGVVLMYPGFSLHDELRKLVDDAGLSPSDALRAATYNLAAFYGKEGEFGSIEVGRSADLVLLRADPTKDIRNTTQIAGVMARGRWFDRHALDALLREVEQKAGSTCEGSSLKEVQRQ
jgi:predicted amidohydrolase